MNRIEIDRDACTSCQTCYDACFVDVYRWDDESGSAGRRVSGGLRGLQQVRARVPGGVHQGRRRLPGIYWPEVV